ncbi:MAG TPA: DUF6159 family protein [Steroidobacteraceae bacterium]|jgi:hypothetical protein
MFDKISRSWSLAGQCWDVLKEDPALLLFPLMSSIAMLVILGSFALPVFALYHSVDPHTIRDTATHTGRAMFYLGTYVFYVMSYTVMMFFNSALISVALKRLDGESATVGDGLRTAFENLPAIVGYALVAATVGTILRAIEERVGLIGRLVVALIGAGWTLATAMTLPVLIEEGVGPIDAISRSLELLKRNWGENLIGNGGISLGIAVVAVPIMLVALFIMMSAMSGGAIGSMVLGVAVFALACILLGLVSSTLHSIYTAALYRFATGAKENAGIDGDLLSAAFRPK